MKISIFACLSLIGTISVTTAMAADPRTKCHKTLTAGYRIFFDHDKPKTDTDAQNFFTNDAMCKTEYTTIKNGLESIAQSKANLWVYVIVGTDNTGDRAYNEKLAARRGAAVSKLFANRDIFPTESDKFKNITFYYTGETDQNVHNNDTPSSNASWRSVDIIIAGPEKKQEIEETGATEINLSVTFNIKNEQITKVTREEYDDTELKIGIISNKLETMNQALDTSVWKNKDGNFNTTRLASDSIAGVVLGTAGGLITSNVIKKNQLRGGFEDLHCTVGGQIVAGYNDDFMVNIRQ